MKFDLLKIRLAGAGLAFIMLLVMLLPNIVHAEEVGYISAIEGKVEIYRGKETVVPARNDRVHSNDVITTWEKGRIKIVFSDDSVITLFAYSNLDVKEYFYNTKEKKGKSIFKLVDGKLKALVGKTKLEVHTPTAVAASRGTYFFAEVFLDALGAINSRFSLLEGMLDLKHLNPRVTEVITLTAGQASSNTMDEKFTEPAPINKKQLKDLLSCKIVNNGN